VTPGHPDLTAIRRHLLALDESVQVLRRHQGGTVERLEQDLEEQWVVAHGLQLCAQNVLDIATHIAAGAGRDVPDYGSALDLLAQLGVLPADFVARFRGVAGFRNVVVHGYLNVDLRVVHTLLNDRLDDFTEFARRVSAWLESNPR
jgi:uncharacterized protein YutE (UPF0331/DUF86 family)